jgi:hypothetical protein
MVEIIVRQQPILPFSHGIAMKPARRHPAPLVVIASAALHARRSAAGCAS